MKLGDHHQKERWVMTQLHLILKEHHVQQRARISETLLDKVRATKKETFQEKYSSKQDTRGSNGRLISFDKTRWRYMWP